MVQKPVDRTTGTKTREITLALSVVSGTVNQLNENTTV